MRRPEAMERGKAYKLIGLAKEKSKFPDRRSGKDVFKTLAVYEDFGMIFYTYMPYHFDNKSDEYYGNHNKDIKDGKNTRVVFYGKIAGSVELDLLLDGEEVNETKLKGVRTIMELEAGVGSSPKKFKTE